MFRVVAGRGIVAFLAGVAVSACCTGGGPDYLTLGISGTTPRWGETFEYAALELTASFDEGKQLGGEVFEVYAGDLRTMPVDPVPPPLELMSTEVVRDRNQDDGCGVGVDVTYDLTSLEPGTYTVVHRRANGTGDRINCTDECPWTSFDGEEALVMTLVLTAAEATHRAGPRPPSLTPRPTPS